MSNGGGSGKEQKGSGSLGLSATALRTLGNSVAVEVFVVAARVCSDGSGDGTSSGKGKDKVQKVNSSNDNGEGQDLDKAGGKAVEDANGYTKRGTEDGKVDLGVDVVLGSNERASETHGDHEEEEKEYSKSRVNVCVNHFECG